MKKKTAKQTKKENDERLRISLKVQSTAMSAWESICIASVGESEVNKWVFVARVVNLLISRIYQPILKTANEVEKK